MTKKTIISVEFTSIQDFGLHGLVLLAMIKKIVDYP